MDAALQRSLEQALQLHQSNHPRGLAQAEQLYQQILSRYPHDPNALHLYGLLAHQTNRMDLAISLLTKATQSAPDISAFHTHLGSALHAGGKLDQAIGAFARALQLAPTDIARHRDLAVALATAGRIDQAIVHFENAVNLKPDDPEALYNLGTAHL